MKKTNSPWPPYSDAPAKDQKPLVSSYAIAPIA